MLISKLELTNYRQFATKTVEFTEGLNTLRGRNGTGKTTVVEAIGFALFGSTMQRGKSKTWIKRGETHGGVKLYIGDFIIERSDLLAILYSSDGSILARNSTGITEWVERNFGLTPDLYRTSFYIGQKDIGSFAALSPMERTKRVEKLLRIDRLDEVKTQVREAAKAEANNVIQYENKLAGLNITPFADVSEDLKLWRKTLEDRLVAQAEYKIAVKAYNEYVENKAAWDGVSYDLKFEEAEYLFEIEHNASIDSKNKLIREKQRLVRNLKNVNVLEKYFTMSEREIMVHESTHKSIATLKQRIEELPYNPVEHRDIDYQIKELASQVDIYKLNCNIPEECPTCKQPWPTKATVDLKKQAKLVDQLEENLIRDKGEQHCFELEEELRDTKVPELSWQELQEASVSLEHKASYLRLKELEDVADEFETPCLVRAIDYVRQQEALRVKIAVEATKPTAPDVQEARTNVAKLESLQRSYEMYMRDKIIEEEYTGLLGESIDKVDELKKFIKFIDLYRKSFGAKVIPLLEKNVSSIVNYLSEGKYTEVKINNDYAIDDFDFYSGSEQDSVSFALRLAISQVSRIGDFKTMLLDEVAASFDAEREKLLLEVLKQQDTQLIYITHGALD